MFYDEIRPYSLHAVKMCVLKEKIYINVAGMVKG